MIETRQRFTRAHRCPVCGGADADPRGRGIRCFGFVSDDGRYAHCTRAEYAGQLPLKGQSETYAHRLDGPCACGHEHGVRGIAAVRAPSGRHRSSRIPSEYGTWECAYLYLGPDGTPAHRTVRFRDPKGFAQQRYERGRWRWKLRDTEPVLYRLPELLAADPRRWVFLSEGEKDADRLAGLGLVATTNPCGARHWDKRYSHWLSGRHVAIVEDNDEAGRMRTASVCAALHEVAASIQVLSFPDMPAGGDVSDWLDAGGDVYDLLCRLLVTDSAA